MGRVNDDTDRRLLALLVSNARQSTVALAKKLGLARTTVHERIARLEKTGVIQGYTAVLGASETADNFARCLVLLAILQKRQRAIVERIMAFPEVKLCLTINGEFDLMLSIEVRSTRISMPSSTRSSRSTGSSAANRSSFCRRSSTGGGGSHGPPEGRFEAPCPRDSADPSRRRPGPG
jgi:DNA-binding Lrp family transcriptional regulator